ncbi:hypothetical protein ACFQY4_21460 [Catellatospora bangladeshensis]|uniref:hypothetical protein n=1 Tax=Catellatospora bangladeshensis TaxID=310355 RepID=UPI003615B428
MYFGSAVTGAGVPELMSAVTRLLPTAAGDPAALPSGSVFKVERGPAGEKVAYVRMFDGTVRVRDRLPFGEGRSGKVTAISVFDHGGAEPRTAVGAGEIAQVTGLAEVRIGDTVGAPRDGRPRHTTSRRRRWRPWSCRAAPPTGARYTRR